tara:strand:- start:15960 stop:16292 length:333 start_codon:yes stop_codon:yes gene_type:complete
MRDIKFRYYSHKSNEMRSWDDLQKLHVHTVFKMMQPECKLMQFTGLKDKNGVDIYDGDIVQDEEHYYSVISWDNDDSMYVASDVGGLADMCFPVKVIGNIYENPELFKIT